MIEEEYPLVFIDWIDSHSAAGWHQRDEALPWINASDMSVNTVGWLIEDTPDYIVVASSINPNEFGDLFKIPRFALKSEPIPLQFKQESLVYGRS